MNSERNGSEALMNANSEACAKGVPAEVDPAMAAPKPSSRDGCVPVVKISDTEALFADANWAMEEWAKGTFDSGDKDYIAVHHRSVLEWGDDPNELQQKWSAKLNVPCQRIFVKYVGPGDYVRHV